MKFRYKIRSNEFWKIAFVFSLLFFAAAWQTQAQTKRKIVKPKAQTKTIIINQSGYQPVSLRLKRGVPARLTFIRRTEQTCATEVVFSAYGITRQLPLNQAVVVSFTPKNRGEYTFTCGMNMMRGKLIVQ